jgi:hypothetical protein
MAFQDRLYVNTSFNCDEIRQSTTSDSDLIRKHADDVIKLKEQGVIDALVALGWTPPSKATKFTNEQALRIRAQASNWLVGDDEFLKMLNKEVDA